MKLERLKSLKNINVGDCFTIITPEFEELVVQFIGRNPMIPDKECSSKSGYFVEIYGKKEMHYIEEDELTKRGWEFYIGYDEEFILERRIDLISYHYNALLTSLQDRLETLKKFRSEKAE